MNDDEVWAYWLSHSNPKYYSDRLEERRMDIFGTPQYQMLTLSFQIDKLIKALLEKK